MPNPKSVNEKKKKNLLFIIDHIYALAGGTENQVVKLIQNLDQNKYRIHLITLRETQWIKSNPEKLNCIISIFSIYQFSNLSTYIQILKLFNKIKSFQPDAVITFFSVSNIIGVILSYLARVSKIFSTRRDFGLWITRKDFPILKLTNLFVRRIIVNSDQVKEIVASAENISLNRIAVIHNGIDINKFLNYKSNGLSIYNQLNISKKKNVIGIVGGLKPMKKHDVFLKAARVVVDQEPDTKFVIVGDGPERTKLDELHKNLELENSVFFVGSQTDIRPFLNIFTIAVNCSSNEGLSNAVMEYMASGIPCIVTNAGGNCDLVKNDYNGLIFELDNYRELATQIIYLLKHREISAILAQNSIKSIKYQFCIESMIRRYENLFAGHDPIVDQ